MYNKKLAAVLNRMAKEDQNIRRSGRVDLELDKKNVLVLKEIIQKHGWPTINLVGRRASNNAWLIIQHADFDLAFQQKCLILLRKVAKDKRVSPENLAYLTDRVLVNKGKSQIYGTQFYTTKSGKLLPRPIKNVSNIDKRRAALNLSNFKSYQEKLSKYV